jgi:hypothetical protein
MISIKTEFEKSFYDYDKSTNFVDTLPFKSECYLQPNELSYYKTFNLKMSHIYDNLLYLYSRCSIPSYKIPSIFNGFIGVSGTSFGIYDSSTDSQFFSAANHRSLDFTKNATVYKANNKNYIIINSLSSLDIIEHDLELNEAFYKNKITTVDPISGELKFKKINSLMSYKNNLYLSDEQIDIVYKYDLERYFSNENIYKDQLFLLNNVGNQGDRYDSIRFEKPQKIALKNDLMVVEDFDNKILKLYNTDLNFLSYKTVLSLYKEVSTFQTIKFENDNTFNIVLSTGYYSFEINLENYQIIQNDFVSLSAVLNNGEKIIDIEYCSYEDDIFYILTPNSLIKKWKNNPEKIIGRKKASDFGNGSTFKWFTTINNNLSSNYIYVYLYNSTSKANQILIYNDNFNLITCLNDPGFEIYSKDEINVKKEEWNQSWVYNKSIRKMAENIEKLRSNIFYRFYLKEDEYEDFVYAKKVYNTEILAYSALNYNKEFVVGINENFQSSVINRELEKLYNLEQNILDKHIFSILEV